MIEGIVMLRFLIYFKEKLSNSFFWFTKAMP